MNETHLHYIPIYRTQLRHAGFSQGSVTYCTYGIITVLYSTVLPVPTRCICVTSNIPCLSTQVLAFMLPNEV